MNHANTPVLGFSTNVYDNPAEIEGLVDKILVPFKAIEIELEDEAAERVLTSTPDDYRRLVQSLRSRLEKGTEFVSVHSPYLSLSTDLASMDESIRRVAVQKAIRAIEFCADIGGDRITCHPGFVAKGVSQQGSLAVLQKSLLELQKVAEPAKVQICVENMGKGRPKYLVLSSEEHLNVAKETGTFVTLDLVHVATWSLDASWLKNEIATYAAVTKNVHMNDMPVGQHRHVPIGSGIMPLHLMISELMKNDYRGPFIIDEFARPIPADDYFSRSIAFAEEIRHAYAI